MKILRLSLAFIFVLNFPRAAWSQQDAPPEPEPPELTTLRQQFLLRADADLAPLREKYRKELQKLEARLTQERKLSEAAAVKAEQESPELLPADGKGSYREIPKTAADLQRYLKGTVWMVYAYDDKKLENLLNVYHFTSATQALLFANKEKCVWGAKSGTEAMLDFSAGEIKLAIDAANAIGVGTFQQNKYRFVLSGRPAFKK